MKKMYINHMQMQFVDHLQKNCANAICFLINEVYKE